MTPAPAGNGQTLKKKKKAKWDSEVILFQVMTVANAWFECHNINNTR